MPPQFLRHKLCPRKFPFVQVEPKESVFVQLLQPPAQIMGSPIHYVPKGGASPSGTVLCYGDECAYCHLKTHQQWWCAVKEWVDPIDGAFRSTRRLTLPPAAASGSIRSSASPNSCRTFGTRIIAATSSKFGDRSPTSGPRSNGRLSR